MSARYNRTGRRRPGFAPQSLLAVVAAAALTAGCNRLDDYTAADLGEPGKRHAIGFSSEPETLYVELPANGAGLSTNQQADIYRFVERYKQESTGRLRIATPRSAIAKYAFARSMRQVEDIVRDAGVPGEAVVVSRYSESTPYGPALRMGYERPLASAPSCRDWSEDLGENRERLPYADFGCATQRNLALTVANARDLQVPQDETLRSSERRSGAWTKYIGGDSGGGSSSTSTGAATASPAPAVK